MSNTKFTKSPWQISRVYGTLLQVNSNGADICDIDCSGAFNDSQGIISPSEEEQANAHLIKMSPDMYAEIQSDIDKLKASLEVDGLDNMLYLDIKGIIDYKEKLLAKARGEQC